MWLEFLLGPPFAGLLVRHSEIDVETSLDCNHGQWSLPVQPLLAFVSDAAYKRLDCVKVVDNTKNIIKEQKNYYHHVDHELNQIFTHSLASSIIWALAITVPTVFCMFLEDTFDENAVADRLCIAGLGSKLLSPNRELASCWS